MQASRNVGVGTSTAGLALFGAVLIGDVTATTSNYWSQAGVIGALSIGSVLLAVGLWSLGSVYLGWPWPKTHEEKTAERAKRDHDALFAHLARRDALQELRDELEQIRRDLGIQLANERTFGVNHPATAWAKNRHVLGDDPETRELVHDAYLKTHALNQATIARYNLATQNEANDPAWQALSQEERKEREGALDAVEKALAAVTALQATDNSP
jgi:hypothetical protein